VPICKKEFLPGKERWGNPVKRQNLKTLKRAKQPVAVKTKDVVPKWDLSHLQEHLQGVVDLELWTIPYYMTVMYSIKDPSCVPYRLIQSAIYQEMLHAQLAGNIANAFGYSPIFTAPVYKGDKVPHIDFSLDVPNPTETFTPYTAELGPLDEKRLNTMCLVEYPEWQTERRPDLREDVEDYGSIGEFYVAVEVGMFELRHHLRGRVKQVDYFSTFYQNFPQLTITRDGDDGFKQAVKLIEIITDQGEGQTEGDTDVPVQYQNTADGFMESWPHFRKFMSIRDLRKLPETFSGVPNPKPGSPGHKAQQILMKDFATFLQTLDNLFSGKSPGEFGSLMAKLGGDILTCWQRNAIPRFS
jgi:ferritin-like protein